MYNDLPLFWGLIFFSGVGVCFAMFYNLILVLSCYFFHNLLPQTTSETVTAQILFSRAENVISMFRTYSSDTAPRGNESIPVWTNRDQAINTGSECPWCHMTLVVTASSESLRSDASILWKKMAMRLRSKDKRTPTVNVCATEVIVFNSPFSLFVCGRTVYSFCRS